MKFYQRFAYYSFGMIIGMVFLFMFLSGKDMSCSYFPNSRVLKDLRTKPFHYSDESKEKLNQKWVDTSDIRRTLTYGDVIFGKSNIPTGSGKLYVIEGKNSKNEPITLEVINYSDRAVLKDIIKD
ncbi:DUF4258 domain-containing protein [Flavobacterium antarcticum]|uniref:DUF4258 domain-containing protein n=1 Tax=Flavobacterium antarcticum TaxID=271155 RepID=UPI0003B3EF9D|nr:DUF4258 domain-containing protein [Flavobacterium antarcticum]